MFESYIMNHKERVKKALAGEGVDRPPMWYGADILTTRAIARRLGVPENEESVLKALDIDFRTIRPLYTGPPLKTYADGSCDTVWGIRRGGSFYGQALNHPLAAVETVREVEQFAWPSVEQWDVAGVKRPAEEYHREYAVIGGAWSPFFHDVLELFGMETLFLKIADNPAVVECAVARCLDFYLELSRRAFEETADSLDMFFFGNDFGGQQGLLCSPAMWRKFFAPGVERLIALGHKYGLKTALHACGAIREIIPDLIEMGMDILNPVQVSAAGMEPEQLKKDFGKDIVFFGGIDVQHILNRGTEDEVKTEVGRITRILGGDFRYILAPAHDYLLPEIPPENIIALYRSGLNAY